MKIKSLIVTLVSIFLLVGLSGCGQEKSAQSCKVQVEMDLDTANSASEYQAVASLIDGACSSAFTTQEKSEYKIATYFGEIGLNLQSAGTKFLAKDANMTEILTTQFGNETVSIAMENAVTAVNAVIGSANCTNTSLLTTTEKEFCSIKELALTMDAISLLLQTGLELDKSSNQTYLEEFLGNSTTYKKVEKSSVKLSGVIGSANCSVTDNLTVFQNLACSINNPIVQAKGGAGTQVTFKAITGGETFTNANGTSVTVDLKTALSSPATYGIAAGNATILDINGNGVMDNAEITGLTVGYALGNATVRADYTSANSTGSIKNGTILITELGNKTFTDASSNNFTYGFIKVIIDDNSTDDRFTLSNSTFTHFDDTNHKKLVYKLVDESKKNIAVTDGTCDVNFTSCTPSNANSTTCLPCPVIKSDGTTLDSTESLIELVNSDSLADNTEVQNAKKDYYCADWDNATQTPADKATVCADNATTAAPDLTAADIANFFSSAQ